MATLGCLDVLSLFLSRALHVQHRPQPAQYKLFRACVSAENNDEARLRLQIRASTTSSVSVLAFLTCHRHGNSEVWVLIAADIVNAISVLR